jgi:pectate lyase
MNIDIGKESRALYQLVQNYVEKLISYALDKNSSLFVNALEPATKKWLPFDTVASPFVTANPAQQQNFFRLLKRLSVISRDQSYLALIDAAYKFMFNRLTDSRGLLYWGGHISYNPEEEKIIHDQDKGLFHELKYEYPAYEIMWEFQPHNTKRFIEAYWNAHILDWSILDFNRHGAYEKTTDRQWDHQYTGGKPFFWGKGLTFVNAGSNLYYAAALLAYLTGEKKPLAWAKSLAQRYVETRQEPMGISGYQYSQCETSWCHGPLIKGDRAQYQFAPYLPEGHLVLESTLFKPVPAVQRCGLFLSGLLGEQGTEFKQWVHSEITAWAKYTYRSEDNIFIPMLTDGYNLENFIFRKDGYYGKKGESVKPYPADGNFFWLYCMGTRYFKDEFLWDITRSLARGLGLGDLGTMSGSGMRLASECPGRDYRLLYGLIELYKLTGQSGYLEMAYRLIRKWLNASIEHDFFIIDKKVIINNPLPLAIINVLAATLPDTPSLFDIFI